jgi:hypothetical protein
MLKLKQISLIAVLAIGIGALAVPGWNIVPAAFASGHHHHHDNHNHVSIHQHTVQVNACDSGASCDNAALNSASVDLPHHSSNHVHISQSIDQANLCSGSGTTCSNAAENDANVS